MQLTATGSRNLISRRIRNILEKYREGPIDFLELGVSLEASVLIWREFFPKGSFRRMIVAWSVG
jgi:hypothetical protein